MLHLIVRPQVSAKPSGKGLHGLIKYASKSNHVFETGLEAF
jgi:hypothetical protein